MSPGPKPKHTDSMSLRLEPELRKILLEMAEREDRTPSQMARILLKEAIAARGDKKNEASRRERKNS